MTKFDFSKLILVGLALGAAAQASTTFTLNPVGGALFGTAGSVVGWGFTISNNTNYLVVDATDFCVGAAISPCSNTVGVYTDFTASNFIVVGPSPESISVTQSFDNATQQGTGSFTINTGLPVGTSVTGNIILTYDLFSVSPNDPNFKPGIDTISTGNTIQAVASVQVVPEPGTLGMMGVGCVAFALARRARNQISRLRRLG